MLSDKPKIIYKSNELIEARYSLSLGEQRLVLLLASEITPDDEDFKDYEIRVMDFAKMFNLESDKSLYEKVEVAANTLLGKVITLKSGKEVEKTVWLSYVKYVRGSGVVRLRFDKSLKPYFIQLKSHFTKYQSNYVMDFKSQYSIRLYELLKMDSFKLKNGQFEKYFEVSELRLILGVDKKDYALFADFRRFVIQPATTEISDKTDLFINDVLYGKTGRKVTNITFVVGVRSERETKLRQANLRIEDIEPENTSENHPIIDRLVSVGFSLEVAKKFKNKYGVKKLERNLTYTLAKKQAGQVKDVPAYLNMAIENDYGGAWDIENQKKVEAKKQKDQLEVEKRTKEKQEQERKKEEKEKTEQMLTDFEKIPEAKKREIIESYLLTVPEIISPTTKSAYKKYGADVYKKSAQFKGLFLPYLKSFLENESLF
jgi:plasmid replication initiation protein